MKISENVKYVGVDDHKIDLFEGQYVVPNGMAYNSYIIFDEKIAVVSTVDASYEKEWLANVERELAGKEPDYLIVQHVEPDHSACITAFCEKYKKATVVASAQAFVMIKQFFGVDYKNKLVVQDKSELSLGKRELVFVSAPMVHWPEVVMVYEKQEQILFSADAFGKFGANDTPDDDWACEARRYYFGIVGKFGMQVQSVLKKLSGLKIETICPLHGPVLTEKLGYYLNLYNTWSAYGTESEGIAIFYTSVYGNTKLAVQKLEKELLDLGAEKVVVNDLARSDMAEMVEDAFRYGKIVLATTTYNNGIFPFMHQFLSELAEHNYQNKKIGLIENGTWAPMASNVMKKMLETCKNIEFAKTNVKILSALSQENEDQIKNLAKEMMESK